MTKIFRSFSYFFLFLKLQVTVVLGSIDLNLLRFYYWAFWNDLLEFPVSKLTIFFILQLLEKNTREESLVSNFHTTLFQNIKCQIFIHHFFKIVLHWCLGLICYNVGTPLKHNKYICDIPIPFWSNWPIKSEKDGGNHNNIVKSTP